MVQLLWESHLSIFTIWIIHFPAREMLYSSRRSSPGVLIPEDDGGGRFPKSELQLAGSGSGIRLDSGSK